MPKNRNTPREGNNRWLVIICLVFAGEMIFSLPFHVARFFRPTFLDVFNLTNAQLGDAIAVYGITAMLAYFPGGVIADRFSPRKLMAVSLVATAMGGLFMAQIPGQLALAVLFGCWGITTIFLFWAAMIRTTRDWGGKMAQGRAFGFLDGGRGLVAAAVASLAVFTLAQWLPSNLQIVTEMQRSSALQAVIYLYSSITFLAGLWVWFTIPDIPNLTSEKNTQPLSNIRKVFRSRMVWLQAIVVVCAYSGYKALDYYSLYGVDVLGMNEVEAAQFVSNASYLRAGAAIGAGFIVDRFSASRVILITFGLLVVSYFVLGLLVPSGGSIQFILGNILFTFAAVYALRGVYFALLEETRIRSSLTGTAVGLISVIGFTPDAFFNSLAGRILDASPGLKGFQHFYFVLSAFAFAGLAATIILVLFANQEYQLNGSGD